jgi:hypothetical protein
MKAGPFLDELVLDFKSLGLKAAAAAGVIAAV